MFRFGYADSPHGQVHHASAGAGSPLLLLPGSTRSFRQFRALVPLLAPHHRVVAVDTLGYGASAPFPAGGTMETLAESAVSVLDALDIARADVFGMHTGHKVAAVLAAHWPGRVRRLVLAGKTHSIIPDQDLRNRAILAQIKGRTTLPANGAARPLLDPLAWGRAFRSVSSLAWNDALLTGATHDLILAVRDKMADELLSLEDTGAIYAANFAFDFAQAVREVRARTLVLEVTSDAEDRAWGRQGEALARLLADGKVATLPAVDDVGLACVADTAALCEAVLAFLRED